MRPEISLISRLVSYFKATIFMQLFYSTFQFCGEILLIYVLGRMCVFTGTKSVSSLPRLCYSWLHLLCPILIQNSVRGCFLQAPTTNSSGTFTCHIGFLDFNLYWFGTFYYL